MGEANETDRTHCFGHGCRSGLRDDPQNSNLPRRVGCRFDDALPAPATAAASTSSAAAADDQLPGRNDGECGYGLSAASASTTATDQAVRRARIISWGRRESAGPFHICKAG